MRSVPLGGKYGKGKFALVDDEDYEMVVRHNWYAGLIIGTSLIYAKTNVHIEPGKRKKCYLHRMIMGYPESFVDHKDGDTLNNTRGNLRVASASQSSANRRKYHWKKRSKYGSVFIGVKYKNGNRIKPWEAYIRFSNRSISLGCFISEEDAARERDFFTLLRFGEFAELNFKEYDYSNYIPQRLELIEIFGGVK